MCFKFVFAFFFLVISLHLLFLSFISVSFISRCFQWKSTSRGHLVGVDGPAGQASKE